MHKQGSILLIHVTTVPETYGCFLGQIAFMQERDFIIQAASSPGNLLEITGKRENIVVFPVEMHRRITPWADLGSLFKLYRIFRRQKPEIVHAHTPKGGLLGVIAARSARVPIVIYGMRGLPFVTARGWKRKILILSEKLACRLADRVITVSFANRVQAIASGFCKPDKIVVLGKGSSNGVDAENRFNPEKLPVGLRENIRQKYQIPFEDVVLGYVGRIVRDKGLVELAAAWRQLRDRYPFLYLLLTGPIESQDPVPSDVLATMQADPRVKFTGPITDTPSIYASMDILTLPTYREGFPNTPLEAAAMRLPVVATTVDGCSEAVEDGITGLLVPPQNSRSLADAIEKLIIDPDLRRKMGEKGRLRALRDYNPMIIWQDLYKNYQELIKLKLDINV